MCETFCGRKKLTIHMRNPEAVKYTNRSFSDDQNNDRGIGGVKQIEVVGKGSKLMKRMKLPTVFIRLRKGSLEKSRVYHVILLAESGRFHNEIPALMYSNPSAVGRTQTAELLPLGAELDEDRPKCAAFTPVLLRERYKRMFRRGCTFKINALSAGRYAECSENESWSKWNVKLRAIRMLITEIIYQDIQGMPADMMKRVIPSEEKKHALTLTSFDSSSSSVSSTQGSLERNLSTHYPNLKVTGVTASGGSSFAKWFQSLHPDIYIDGNFKCDHGTILGRDRFADSETFMRYLSLS
jgi:hypothetical protein